jgi:hypothetical protein
LNWFSHNGAPIEWINFQLIYCLLLGLIWLNSNPMITAADIRLLSTRPIIVWVLCALILSLAWLTSNWCIDNLYNDFGSVEDWGRCVFQYNVTPIFVLSLLIWIGTWIKVCSFQHSWDSGLNLSNMAVNASQTDWIGHWRMHLLKILTVESQSFKTAKCSTDLHSQMCRTTVHYIQIVCASDRHICPLWCKRRMSAPVADASANLLCKCWLANQELYKPPSNFFILYWTQFSRFQHIFGVEYDSKPPLISVRFIS